MPFRFTFAESAFMTETEILRRQVKKYIDSADEYSLRRVNAILEIDRKGSQWWSDREFIAELDSRYKALETGVDKGVTVEQLQASLKKRMKKQNAK